MLKCPACGAEPKEPCKTPKGRKKNTSCNTRPFCITQDMLNKMKK